MADITIRLSQEDIRVMLDWFSHSDLIHWANMPEKDYARATAVIGRFRLGLQDAQIAYGLDEGKSDG